MSLYRITILIALMTSTIECVQSQMSSCYSLVLGYENYRNEVIPNKELYLSFYENGIYEMKLSEKEYPSPNIYSFNISLGAYTKRNDKIILTDQIIGFQIHLTIVDNDLKVDRGFKFLEGKTLEFFPYNKTSVSDLSHYYERRTVNIKEERGKQKQLYKSLLPFDSGIYENMNNRMYRLNLQQDNKYKLSKTRLSEEVVNVSEGSWKRVGNEIILYDPILRFSFYVFITENGLNGILLPGDFIGYTFKKK